MAKKEALLQEIRRVRRGLDRAMASDPKAVRKAAKAIEDRYGLRTVKARRKGLTSRRKAA